MNFLLTFIKRPVFTTMLVMLLVVFGISSYSRLGIDYLPDVDLPLASVMVTYQGAAPEEMESLVSKPIEDAVSSLSGIKTLSSISRTGVSMITIEFELGTDPKLAANDVREKVAGVRGKLPDEIDEPVVQRVDLTAQPVVYFSMYSDQRSRGEIRKLAEDLIKDRLQRLDGVGSVDVYGGGLREVRVLADPRKMDAYHVDLAQLSQVVDAENANIPGGYVKERGTELTVRTMGKYKSVAEIKDIVVGTQNNKIVRVGDVAQVIDGWEEARTYARTNGKPSVVIAVQKQSGTNTVAVSDAVKREVEKIKKVDLPPDVQLTISRDQSKFVRSSVEDVMMSLIFGGLMAVIITFLFLRNGRATVIGAVAIPLSVIATFSLMKLMNFTINNMSLMGLSLAVGILIDDAIVVIENIYRHLEQDRSSPAQAALKGTAEIALAVMATTFSILAVFVPVGTMGEIVGLFFRQFGLTVAFAVGFSLFVAFSMTPMLSSRFMRINRYEPTGNRLIDAVQSAVQLVLDKFEAGFEAFRDIYEQILRWALRHKLPIIGIAIASLLINLFLIPFVGVEFSPTYDSGEFLVTFSAPPGTSIEKMAELVKPIEQEALQIPEKETVIVSIGTSRQPVNKGSMVVRLVSSQHRNRSMNDIMDELRRKFRGVTDLKVAVMPFSNRSGGDPRPIQINFRGDDLLTLNRLGNEMAEQLRKIPGAADVDMTNETSEPEVQVRFNRARAGEAGVDATTVGGIVQAAFLGKTAVNKYNAGNKDYEIRVELLENARLNVADVANLRIPSKTGGQVRLGDIADVKLSSGPTEISRESRQRQVTVAANAVGASLGEVTGAAQKVIDQMSLPAGYSYEFGGSNRDMKNSFGEISRSLIIAVILIYMVLAAQFESFIHPLTIMVSLPFALVGAILGLLLTGNTINIMSLIGVIMLMGLVTKNAILLIDFTNNLRQQGISRDEALVQAGVTRLRPILMTTAAMILGMLPVAFGYGEGAEIRVPMGVVLVGGLITSTMLTLVVVPLVYTGFDKLQRLLGRNPVSNHPLDINL